jgi:hypothetical protein
MCETEGAWNVMLKTTHSKDKKQEVPRKQEQAISRQAWAQPSCVSDNNSQLSQ